MKSVIVLMIVGLLAIASGKAQTPKPLKVGETCPDVFFSKIINSDVKQAHLSDFEGKWVILYFWGTGCGSCILKMPSIDRLQKKYAKEAAIFTIAHNSEAEIANLWAKNPGIKARNTPLPGTITDDSIMRKYFPNSFVPYLVWIDPQRKVREITDGSYLTEGALNRILDGEDPDWLPLQPLKRKYSYDSLFLQPSDNGAGLPSRVFYSTITSYLHGVGRYAGVRDTLSHGFRYFYSNESILGLYGITLINTPLFRLSNRIFLEDIRDSSRYFHLDKQLPATEWNQFNQYCYEAVLPRTTSKKEFYSGMRSDLDKFFGIHSEMRQIDTNCMYITRLGKENVSKIKRDLANNEAYFAFDLKNFVRFMNQRNPSQLTIFDKKIDGANFIYSPDSLRFKFGDRGLSKGEYKQILNENGYDIRRSQQKMTFLVLSEQ